MPTVISSTLSTLDILATTYFTGGFTTNVPNQQGSSIMWNLSADSDAETDFINIVPSSGYLGGDLAGFHFYNVVQGTATNTLSSTAAANPAGTVPTTTNPLVTINGYGTIACQSTTNYSSRRYKYNIQSLQNNSIYTLDNFMKLQPVTYDYLFNGKETGKNEIGIIAEDVFDIGLKELVSLNKGVVDGLDYSKFTVFIIKIVKEQQIKIEEQQNTINSLITDIELLKQRLTAIEAVVL